MVTGKIIDTAGKIENDTGKIIGKTIDAAGKINQDAGKIKLSEDFSGEIQETAEANIPRYRGQRGPDKKPRDFPLHTLKNLPQFRNKPHKEVRQYILETKGIDIGGNFNWNGFGIVMLIVIAVMVGGYCVWRRYTNREHQNYYQG